MIQAVLSFSLLAASFQLSGELPERFQVVEGRQFTVNSSIPVSAVAQQQDSVKAVSSMKEGEEYRTDLKLFGLVQVKTVHVSVVKQSFVVPCGEPFGVKLHTEGVVIVGMSDVDTAQGPVNPAYQAGIRVGDIILAINGKSVTGNEDVAKIMEGSGGQEVKISLRRGTVGYEAAFRPLRSVSQNAYKAGLWVRDSTAGIGTITFYSPSGGKFGGLGHGICDIDTGEILPLLTGDVVHVDISGVSKGIRGTPGELQGTLQDAVWGSLYCNTQTGVYGVLQNTGNGRALPVAMCQEVRQGPAYILATVDGGGPQKYSVSIERVHFNDAAPTKNMVIRITDPALIAKTGGIVQGMSGCPIIQNGKLVGAVTHVFVNDPLRGYGIFAQNMMDSVDALEENGKYKVS